IAVLVVGNLILQFGFGDKDRVLSPSKSYAFGLILTFMASNSIVILFLFGEDIFRFIFGIYTKLFTSNETFYIPSRRKFISAIAIGAAAIPFTSMLYGMYKGKYNFRVIKHTLHFDDLPEAFDGYRITHISDIHTGSFDNRPEV